MGALDGIEFFTASVEGGSFAVAARRLGVTPSAVSRRVAALEAELGVQLLARTTRSLHLTEDGQAFHERCTRILDELAEARDAIARVKKKPAGLLRVDAPVALGRAVIVPNLPGFLDRYPDIQLDLTFRDRRVDPIAEGLDVLVRMGALRDSTLIARRLGESRIVTCASRAYLSKHGVPERPRDLARHACLGYLREGRPDPFELVAGGGEGSADTLTSVDIKGPLHSNDCDVLVQMAIAGKGITHLFDFLVEPHLRSGALVSVLDACSSRRWPIHALYPKNRHLLPKVRVFLDFLDGLWRPKKPARAARTRAAKGR